MSARTAVATDDGEPQWLSPKDAARLLGVPTSMVYRLIDAGELVAYKHGRTIRLLQHEVVWWRDHLPDDPNPDQRWP